MSNLALIQPSRVDFDTQQTCDWLDALPVLGVASPGGVMPGAANVGTGTAAVAAVAPGTPLGHVVARITAVVGSVTQFTVTDLAGQPIGQGVVGLPLYAGGATLTLTQGSVAFAVGDAFAIGVLPQPLDLTGLRFDLDARAATGAASYALQASTADATPTILNGGGSGVIAMQVPRATMAACAVKPGGYPYSILATDPASGLVVPAFYGLIRHVAIAAQLGA